LSGAKEDEEEEKVSSSSTKPAVDSTDTLDHTLGFLKGRVNEHVFVDLVSYD
jgi:hypothetical protein